MQLSTSAVAAGSTSKEEPRSFLEKTFDDPVAAFTLWLAIVTSLLWFYTFRLWKDGKKSGEVQADRMEQSVAAAARAAAAMEAVAAGTAENSKNIIESVALSRRAMRAYLSVVIGEATYQDDKLRFEVRPRIINRGATEARNVRWKIAADIIPIPVPDDFRYPLPKDFSGGAAIGSQLDGLISGIVPYRLPQREAEAVKYLERGRALTVWGFVSYKDIFGRTHRTTFAQQIYWLKARRKPLLGTADEPVKGQYLNRHNIGN